MKAVSRKTRAGAPTPRPSTPAGPKDRAKAPPRAVSDEFVARFDSWLVAFCRQLTWDADQALDLAQEVWVRAVRYGPPADAGPAWLERVARNEFLRPRTRARIQPVALTPANDPGSRAGDPARLAEWADLLGRLAPVDRGLVVGRVEGRETWKESAARHRLSLWTTKRRYHAAVARLRSDGRRGG